MEKKFDINLLKDYMLSPGNIYWKKSTGNVLISSKNTMINDVMILKIYEAGQQLEITNSIDLNRVQEFDKMVKSYKSEISLKDKIPYRKKILDFYKRNFLNFNTEQSELNQLCWVSFSKINKEKTLKYINKDFEYFMRSQNIASSYVTIAFILGYYDYNFLQNLYNETINNFMLMTNNISVRLLRERMEKLRKSSELDSDDEKFIKLMTMSPELKESLIFERLDGKGAKKLTAYELNELQTVFCNLCYHYGYEDNATISNILWQIENNEFLVKKPILNTVKSNLRLEK